MLKSKFPTENGFFKCGYPLSISDENLAIDARWHEFYSNFFLFCVFCFVFFYSISQPLKTGSFSCVFALVSPPTQIFFHASSVSIMKFICHILPLLDEDIRTKAVSCWLFRPISTPFFLPVPSLMPFPALLHLHVWLQADPSSEVTKPQSGHCAAVLA